MSSDNRKKIDINPHKSLWWKLGRNKYTIPKALSDLIDNSIDNKDEKKDLDVEISFEIDGNWLKLKDNARGMGIEELGRALTIAHHVENDTIGEYGFGLKSATSYLAKKFTIYTKTSNANEVLKFTYDEAEFLKSNDWSVEIEVLSIDEALSETAEIKFEQGTIIILRDLNVKLYNNLKYEDDSKGALIPKLKRMYKNYLGRGLNLEINITTKTEQLSIDVQPYHIEDLLIKAEFEVKLIETDGVSKTVTGWFGILPYYGKWKSVHKSIYEYSGFLVVKNKKILLENEYIGYNFHPETRLITGELNLDQFDVLTTKNDFVRNDDWTHLEMFMKDIIIPPLKTLSFSKFLANSIVSETGEVKEDFNKKYRKLLGDALKSCPRETREIYKDVCIDLKENFFETFKEKFERENKKNLNSDELKTYEDVKDTTKSDDEEKKKQPKTDYKITNEYQVTNESPETSSILQDRIAEDRSQAPLVNSAQDQSFKSFTRTESVLDNFISGDQFEFKYDRKLTIRHKTENLGNKVIPFADEVHTEGEAIVLEVTSNTEYIRLQTLGFKKIIYLINIEHSIADYIQGQSMVNIPPKALRQAISDQIDKLMKEAQ